MTNKKQDKTYEPPRVTSVDFMVENGFTESQERQQTIIQNDAFRLGSLDGESPSGGTENAEGRYNGGNWGGDNGWF